MKQIILSLVLACILVSCNNETSLQEYYVEKQEDREFLSLDLPISTLISANSSLDSEQKRVLETIRKVNLLAYPIKDGQGENFEQEKLEIETILQDEKYESLMRFGRSGKGAQFYLVGDEDAIDEFVVYGNDEERGFMIARVLGEDMKVNELYDLFESLDGDDITEIPGLGSFLESTVATPINEETSDTIQ